MSRQSFGASPKAILRPITAHATPRGHPHRRALQLTVRTARTHVLLPTHAVHIVDYRRDLGDPEAFEIEVYLSQGLAVELKQSILGNSR